MLYVTLTVIFHKVLYMSIVGSVLGILAMLIAKLVNNTLTAKWKCAILMVSLLFFIIPINRIEINVKNEFAINKAVDKIEDVLNIEYVVNKFEKTII